LYLYVSGGAFSSCTFLCRGACSVAFGRLATQPSAKYPLPLSFSPPQYPSPLSYSPPQYPSPRSYQIPPLPPTNYSPQNPHYPRKIPRPLPAELVRAPQPLDRQIQVRGGASCAPGNQAPQFSAPMAFSGGFWGFGVLQIALVKSHPPPPCFQF
jgi:hypothetical protein